MAGRNRGKRLIELSDDEEAGAQASQGRGGARRRAQEEDELEVVPENGDEVEVFDPEDSDAEERPRAKKKPSKRAAQGSQDGNDAFEMPSSKKKSGIEDLTVADKNLLVGNIVRYILFKDSVKQPIRRAEIGDKAIDNKFKDRKRALLPALIKEAQDKLRTVFGAELVEQKKKNKQGVLSGTGTYYLRSNVDSSALVAKFADNKERAEEYGFLLTLIALIQMSENHVLPEEKLQNLMRAFPPPPSWMELLAKFAKAGYIRKVKRKDSPNGGFDFHVGPRALCELKPTAVPEFLSKVFGEEVEGNRAKDLEFDLEADAPDDEDDAAAASQAPGASQSQRGSQRGRKQ